jgi:hypothetical protein
MADDGSRRFVVPSGSGFLKGGSAKGGGVNETPNTLRSRQVAKIVDLLGEGIIKGLHDGLRSVCFDGVRVQNKDGSYNVKGFAIEYNNGAPDQLPLAGFPGTATPVTVGVQIKVSTPQTRTITNGDTNRVRLTMSVPALTTTTDTGEIKGSAVTFSVYLQSGGSTAGYQKIDGHTIRGKTTGRYQRDLTYTLTGLPPWDIRIERDTPDSTKISIQNDLYWDAYYELVDARVRYRYSAVVGTTVDAEQFSSIPVRVYDLDGLQSLRIPTNYDPYKGTYTGSWGGNFKTDWTNNPAWILYDLVTNNRYGIGDYIKAAEIDKWSLYSIGVWCDEPVPNGRGQNERRWVCNAVIGDRQEAFDLLQSICSVFRGGHYWSGGLMTAIADKPQDFVGTYTNANVERGDFTYAGSDLRARHTQVAVHWNDPDNLGQPRTSLIDDHDAIARYGLSKIDVTAIGCTSEGQAVRTGKWTLYTEVYETETVSFTVGLEGAWCKPGDIIQVSDLTVTGERRGGRLVQGSQSQVTLDAPVVFHELAPAVISCVVPHDEIINGQLVEVMVETVSVIIPALDTPVSVLDLAPPYLSANPEPDTVWVLSTGDVEPTLWRVVAVEENDLKFSISAMSHDPGKWAWVERDVVLGEHNITTIGVPTISDLKATEYLVALSALSVGSMVNLSWSSTAPFFDIQYRQEDNNWTTLRVAALATDLPVSPGHWEFRVTPIDMAGFRGTQATLSIELSGLAAPPTDPVRFRSQILGQVLHLQWAPSEDLDVLIGGTWELRYSPNAGADWTSSNPVIMAIPGSATTVELPNRPGTYLLKARDSSGVYSVNAGVITSTQPDTDSYLVYTIQEHPNGPTPPNPAGWLGSKANTEIYDPTGNNWLVLGQTGGLWDDTITLMDTWPDVDVLPFTTPPALTFGTDRVGTYNFNNRIDLGGVFTTTLTVDMLAFPFIEGTPFIDDRTTNVDTWTSWDDPGQDASGQVMIRVRQTDDNPIGTPTWSAFNPFVSGDYTGRAFEFQAVLVAPYGEQVAVETLAVTADLHAKSDNDNDVAWAGTAQVITFAVKFYLPPSISIQMQDGVSGDYAKITAKSTLGFTLTLYNASNAVISAARTFDWQAQGY